MPRPQPSSSEPPDWPQTLRASGLRATATTISVLRLLAQAPAPMTHAELQEAIASETGSVPNPVTLYRVLERLTEAGLCDTLAGADRRGRFALHANGSGHVFECSHCHTVVPLPENPELPAALERWRRSLRRKGMQTEQATVTLRGLCRECDGGTSPPHKR